MQILLIWKDAGCLLPISLSMDSLVATTWDVISTLISIEAEILTTNASILSVKG